MKRVLPLLLLAVACYAQIGSCSGHHNVLISWTASVTPDVTLYNIYRASQSGGPYSLIGNTSGLSYVDSNVGDGQSYYYVLTALDEGGESAYSTEVACAI